MNVHGDWYVKAVQHQNGNEPENSAEECCDLRISKW